MLNKRAATLLVLVLAGSMVLSEPSASWVFAKETAKASQSESEKTGGTDLEKEEKAEGKTAEQSANKEKKKTGSSNSASSNKTSSNKTSSNSSSAQKSKITPSAPAEKEANLSRAKADSDKEDSASKGKEDDTKETDAKEIGIAKPSTQESDAKEENAREDSAKEDSVKEENPFTVNGGEKDKDYDYDGSTGVLTVRTGIGLAISGTVSSGSINIDSTSGADLTLDGLRIAAGGSRPTLRVPAGTSGVQLHLKGYNELQGIQVEDTGDLTIDGTGILSGAGIQGTVKIKGGNILAPVDPATDISGKPLYPNPVSGNLSSNTLYQVSGDSLPGYEEGVYSSPDRRVTLYLPQEEAQVAVSGNTLVVSDAPAETATPTPSGNTATPTPSDTSQPFRTPTPTPTPTATPTATPAPDIASEANNGLYWINSGSTYQSGATLQFYATGAGYGPEEPQELNPVNQSVRYVPVEWEVYSRSTLVSQNSVKGSWTKYTEETKGYMNNGQYIPGEYRFKGSFVINTTGSTAVPYTLQTKYQREVYNGKSGKWKEDGSTAFKSVDFYIKNISATATVTPTPTATPWIRATVTTAAAGSSISSNARNASTADETPIGTLVLALFASAVSGIAIFRKRKVEK